MGDFHTLIGSKILLDNTELLVGMTIWIEKENGKLVKDVTLKEYFMTSPRFPEIAFRTSAGNIVKYSRCGKSWVSYARS